MAVVLTHVPEGLGRQLVGRRTAYDPDILRGQSPQAIHTARELADERIEIGNRRRGR